MAATDGRPKRMNVLTLDGGGVRGLSALLILQELMLQINLMLRKIPGNEHRTVQPHHIFDLVAGTSTGGLIAIMLGKLGMTVEECINAYRTLSASIFGKKHFRGRLTGGLAPSKYSGTRLRRHVQDLITKSLRRQRLPEVELQMTSHDNEDKIACAVICREHEDESRYSDLKDEEVRICSSPCHQSPECSVCDAARATSAAPTFFPLQRINGRSFVDGGIEFNNPSHTIFDHYIKANLSLKTRPTSIASVTTIPTPSHTEFNFSRVRIVNLGTGTKPGRSQPSRSSGIANLIPRPIRMALFLKSALKNIAVDSERTAGRLRSLAATSPHLSFVRFSADNGVCFVELDDYKQLAQIERLTVDYLNSDKIKEKIERTAAAIVKDFLENERASASGTTDASNPGRLAVPQSCPLRPETPSSELRSSNETQVSVNHSQDLSASSAETTPSKASHAAETEATTPGSETRSELARRECKDHL